ncbi:hypothetical protein TYRP_005371 [Tyrophagus putrescentiae]|nr:hypothetical protein TYRP_005371 [Tyrophagus putrescentiae]
MLLASTKHQISTTVVKEGLLISSPGLGGDRGRLAGESGEICVRPLLPFSLAREEVPEAEMSLMPLQVPSPFPVALPLLLSPPSSLPDSPPPPPPPFNRAVNTRREMIPGNGK